MSEPSPLPIPAASLPAHIAIIMDGNGRWAQERGAGEGLALEVLVGDAQL